MTTEATPPVDGVELEYVGTCFETVPSEILVRLLARSRRRTIGAFEPVFPADQSPHVAIVLDGSVRSYLTASDGRQVTVRYARRGAIIGKYATLVGAHPPLAVQALTECTIQELDVAVFQASMATEISVSSALNVELGRRLEDVYATVGDSAFGSIRHRLIRHLLLNAGHGEPGSQPQVSLTQQQLADAIGSSREVIARHLGQLRREGLVGSQHGAMVLRDADQLVASLNSWQAESPY